MTVGVQDLLSDPSETAAVLKEAIHVDKEKLRIVYGSRRSEWVPLGAHTATHLSRIVHACSQRFDIIVLDAPPTLPVVDSVYFAPICDAIVFAVKWASTPQAEAKSALGKLREHCGPRCEFVGVLNQQDNQIFATKNGYYRAYSE